MLLRREPARRIAIPQPSHAWVSGQLAVVWGNGRFARPEPFADVCLAAALHDIGWTNWEQAPTRDPESGWPREFPQVSPLVHVDLWRDGVSRARLFGRYPALLVSRHADTIYSRHFDWDTAQADVAAAVRAFLEEQHGLQRSLAASLRADPVYADAASDGTVETNRLLIAAVDALSLKLCWGVSEAFEIAQVPVASGEICALSVRPGPAVGIVLVAPWPFGPERLTVTADGLALEEPFASDEALRHGLERAKPVAVSTTLLPG